VFPHRCIMCSCEPNSTVSVDSNGPSLFRTILWPILFLMRWKRLSIPICRSCKPKFFWQRLGRLIGGLAVCGVAAMIIYPLVLEWSRLGRKLATAAAILVALIPYAIFLASRPLSFDLTVDSDKVDYEFASADYAEDFVALNESHVLRSGTTGSPS
jgi:hypothetical protein